MPLTPKGLNALNKIKEFYPHGKFTAKELSDICGEKIVAATLNGIVDNGYLIRLGGSPIQYQAVDDLCDIDFAENSNKGCTNTNMYKARNAKDDEFYTKFSDIEAEIMKYRKQFKNKIVYLPCDDPADKKSEFWSFFLNNFDNFELRKLIATHYDTNGKAYKIWVEEDLNHDGYIDDDDVLQEDLIGNGDFHSDECTEILKECDIVVTNPPFSLFRDFVQWILKENKKFLIIGNQNAFTYKDIFPLMRDKIIWTGYNMVKEFNRPDGTTQKFGNVCWFTNLHTSKHDEPSILTKSYYNASYKYLKYDNYDAINVDKIVDIPKDYDGVMGVPITFLDKICFSQFELIGMSASWDEVPQMKEIKTSSTHRHNPFLNGKEKYRRIFIRKIKK